MSRPIKPRQSYLSDVLALRRVIHAVQKDAIAPEEWKKQVVHHLSLAMSSLLEREATCQK